MKNRSGRLRFARVGGRSVGAAESRRCDDLLQHRIRTVAGRRVVSWLGIVVALVAIYLAIKVVGVVFKLLMCGLLLFGLYWFFGPQLGLPPVF